MTHVANLNEASNTSKTVENMAKKMADRSPSEAYPWNSHKEKHWVPVHLIQKTDNGMGHKQICMAIRQGKPQAGLKRKRTLAVPLLASKQCGRMQGPLTSESASKALKFCWGRWGGFNSSLFCRNALVSRFDSGLMISINRSTGKR